MDEWRGPLEYIFVHRLFVSYCMGGRVLLTMKLTMKGDYGLRAMLDLAAYYGQGPVDSAAIASRQHIPAQYLDQILLALRKDNLVTSVRGNRGGHMLARPPATITMQHVIQSLEGYVPPMQCLPDPDFCQLAPNCALREVWRKIDDITQAMLTSTTIEELARQHGPRRQHEHMDTEHQDYQYSDSNQAHYSND